MKYIRDTYGVPAKRGARVMFGETRGTVKSASGAYLRIRPDDGLGSLLCHPTFRMKYLVDGKWWEPKS